MMSDDVLNGNHGCFPTSRMLLYFRVNPSGMMAKCIFLFVLGLTILTHKCLDLFCLKLNAFLRFCVMILTRIQQINRCEVSTAIKRSATIQKIRMLCMVFDPIGILFGSLWNVNTQVLEKAKHFEHHICRGSSPGSNHQFQVGFKGLPLSEIRTGHGNSGAFMEKSRAGIWPMGYMSHLG